MRAKYLYILVDNSIIEEDSPEFPLLNTEFSKADSNGNITEDGEYTLLKIDIETAKVLNWDPSYGSAGFWCKVVDEGIYIILDEDGNELDRIEGYVPNKLIPEHDGYGDYIDLRITKSGYVSNWYNHPQLDEFSVDFDTINRIFDK